MISLQISRTYDYFQIASFRSESEQPKLEQLKALQPRTSEEQADLFSSLMPKIRRRRFGRRLVILR